MAITDHKHTREDEAAQLAVLREVQVELAHALNSVAGAKMGSWEKFPSYSAAQLNVIAEGYILLRQSGRVDCSKLLVRPAIEVRFRVRAVMREPALLYRIAYGENEARTTVGRRVADLSGTVFDDSGNVNAWLKFRQECASRYPGSDVDKKLSLEGTARAAGLSHYYESHYRQSSTYTHAAIEAVLGTSSGLADREDNHAMAVCAFDCLAVLTGLGAKSPNVRALRDRIGGRDLLRPL